MNPTVRRSALFALAGLLLALIAAPAGAVMAAGLLVPHSLAVAGCVLAAAALL